MAKIAIVKHNGSQTPYAFYTDIDLKKDDLVVCDTQNGYETGRVLRITDSNQGVKPTRWIVSKVDTKSHVERVEKEKRISYLKQQIDMRRNEFTDEYINELISLKDKAMYSLLKELNELTSKSNTKYEIELKDSFYFTTKEVKCKADKCGNFYIVTTPISYWQLQYSIEQVKEMISTGEWKVIDQ
ncbi:hypothetical protein G7L40_20590 [Paenibacillus polymyxa]|uniref:Uncharacterized protein n=1 Tax=Paenibacillus polymyxa TaxID=1406 RepID=A0A378XYS0_PAEPO|nr:hypothetical protein [Paenibacillus polymyxa]MBE7896111.1 hypothetical protein [Paenibacillus polymyxa]MBG9765943.1 hypothetical protein [Paenibacillus polymyxa]MCC3256641.1 hypothetical protein [Paenibacillus polymyxa]QPK54868.1 hypothetical protein G7035_20635 [Paenibacillus polymyxa]QPK59958.1 hypothetical protein G7L40_20590 [Paenibacillus polymyxa]